MRTIHLPVADPCHEDWDAMDPRERGKFCQRCNKDVYDLSAMTEDEASAFLRERAGTRVCVNYRHDDAGRIHFRPTRTVAAAAALTALAACAPHERPVDQGPVPAPITIVEPAITGDVAVPVVPPEPKPIEVQGEIAAPEPVEHMRKGDVAVPNEPCDEPITRTAGLVAPAPVERRHGKTGAQGGAKAR